MKLNISVATTEELEKLTNPKREQRSRMSPEMKSLLEALKPLKADSDNAEDTLIITAESEKQFSSAHAFVSRAKKHLGDDVSLSLKKHMDGKLFKLVVRKVGTKEDSGQ